MKKAKILVVDDEEKIIHTLKGSLEDEGYEVLTANDGQEALEKVRGDTPDVIFLDIWLPGMDGIETLKAIKEFDANLDVVIMTGHGTINTAIQAIKTGAFDFLEKPLSLDSVLSVVNNSLERKRLRSQRLTITPQEEELIGENTSIVSIREEIKKLAKTNKPILITGENGAGKELVARLIHNQSPRRKNPLVKFNCTIYAPEELGNELWGTTIPSSSKKDLRKIGALEKASKGTLFVDSINAMPLETQQELYETLTKVESKASGKNGKSNDVRIIASSTEHLSSLVEEGRFNEELYHLLGEHTIALPPLRERKGDIPALLSFFLNHFSKLYNRTGKELEDEALEALVNHNWPGNIKELKNLIENLVVTVPTIKITFTHLPALIRGESLTKRSRVYDKYTSLKEAEGAWKREFLLFHLKKNNNDLTLTARKLGIRPQTLKKHIAQFDIVVRHEKKEKRLMQKTLKRSMVLSGQGLHSGLKAGLILSPLPPNSGIVFGSITTSETVPAHIDFVESSEYATSLQRGKAIAKTIEHFMAVLHAYHITNLLVKIGDEIPIMDGSALDFCQIIEEAGIEEQDVEVDEIVIDKKYSVGEISPTTKYILIEPHHTFSIHYTLSYPEPVGRQVYTFTLKDSQSFKSHIAPSRTFGFVKDIGELEKKGLASGGRLHNCILIDDEKIVNTELRFPDEFVRHKILDLLGDFYLLGRPIKGKVTAQMTGHSDNNALVKMIRDNLNIYW